MSTYKALFRRYANKAERWESDTVVLQEICAAHKEAHDKQRKAIARWLLKTIERKKINAVACAKVYAHLIRTRRTLTKKQLKRLLEFMHARWKARRLGLKVKIKRTKR